MKKKDNVYLCCERKQSRKKRVMFIYAVRENNQELRSWLFALGVGVVGWCEGAVYLTSPGRPTDIGLQLGKACYPCSG